MHLPLGVLVVLVLVVLNATIFGLAIVLDATTWFDENGIIENGQVVVLAIAFLNLLRQVVATMGFVRVASASATVFCLAFLLREVDLRNDGPPNALDDFVEGPVRATAVIIAIPVFWILFRQSVRAPRALPRLLFLTTQGQLLIIGCLLVASGLLFDKEIIPVSAAAALQWEELVELNGYVMMAVATFVSPG